jgi:ADP-ribose pyrophosphatase YjhB (NUDIX family)
MTTPPRRRRTLVPSVNVAVTNADGDVLLIRRSDNQNWAVPGGAIDLGESICASVISSKAVPDRT